MNYKKIKTYSRTKKKPDHTLRNTLAVGIIGIGLIVAVAKVSALSTTADYIAPVREAVVASTTDKKETPVKTDEKAPERKEASKQSKPADKSAQAVAPVAASPAPATEVVPTPATSITPEVPAAPAPVVDPNGCEAQGMHFRADNNECIPKPAPVVAETLAIPGPAVAVSNTGSGDCATELAKYDWTQSVAYAIMMAESTNVPGVVNNNPVTGDYSVGCFQINLYGANATTRPSEEWLKIAANNVAYAYGIYVSNGKSFLGQWGACSKVGCY